MMSDSEKEKSCYNCGHLKCSYNNNPVSENPVCGDWVENSNSELKPLTNDSQIRFNPSLAVDLQKVMGKYYDDIPHDSGIHVCIVVEKMFGNTRKDKE
jgi:hypothetical protein